LAPEILEGRSYEEKVDTYAYGIVCWELVSRKEVFGHEVFMSVIQDQIISGVREEIPKACLTKYRQIIERCWHQRPELRPPFDWIITKLMTIVPLSDKFEKRMRMYEAKLEQEIRGKRKKERNELEDGNNDHVPKGLSAGEVKLKVVKNKVGTPVPGAISTILSKKSKNLPKYRAATTHPKARSTDDLKSRDRSKDAPTKTSSATYKSPPQTVLYKLQWVPNRLQTIATNPLLYHYFQQYLTVYSTHSQDVLKIYKELLDFENLTDCTDEEREHFASHVCIGLGRPEKKR